MRNEMEGMAHSALAGTPGLARKILKGNPLIEVQIFEEAHGSDVYFLKIRLISP